MMAVELVLLAAVLAVLVLAMSGRWRKPAIWFDGAILPPEELKAHAAKLGRLYRVAPRRRGCALTLRRLKQNFSRITQAYTCTAEDLSRELEVAPAGEWLLDNYYVVEEHVREMLLSVRGKRFRELPVLANGTYRGHPRIYALALELVAHTDGNLDRDVLVNFFNAFQEEQPLTIAEIWSLSLMLRVALVEKIRDVCRGLLATHRNWRLAEEMLRRPEQGAERLRAMACPEPALVERLLEVMRQSDADNQALRDAIGARLLDVDCNIEELVQRSHRAEAARATSLGNAVTSLKNIAAWNWNALFEALCPVDKVFQKDEIYRLMDFESRNYYRLQVQRLARRARVSEVRVAKLAMACAEQGGRGLEGHCGYYLLDAGRNILLQKLGKKGRRLSLTPGAYILAVVLLTLTLAGGAGMYGGRWSWAAAAFSAIPASQVAVSLLRSVLVRLRKPAFLPKLEYADGIPPEAATLVVVPTLLTGVDQAREMVRRLEVHCLANPHDNLYFALLGDFRDAPQQNLPEDEEIAAAVRDGVAALNARMGEERFFALLRRRSYSQTQGKWMGWERKRGALMELNALLMGEEGGSFLGRPRLPRVKYVLTVDADTRLPIDMVKKLVGAISHPINRVHLDERGNVARGYGLIQPRIGVSVESTNRSKFARIMAGPAGLDTYTTAVSDVYQDWFAQGVFTGKGIYDVAAARQRLAVIPENSVLSHDLLEGSLLRTGLATDLELVDDFPTTYRAFVQRHHRWTRGDWQLVVWLGRKSPLGLLNRWQILDNLRRSLVPPALLALLAAGLTVLPGSPLFWAGLFLTVQLAPGILGLLDFNWAGYIDNIAAGGGAGRPWGPHLALAQLGVDLAVLPHTAWINLDAIVRTCWRVFVSRKNLLEWTTAAQAEQEKGGVPMVRPALALVLLLAVAIAMLRPQNLAVYAPFLALWLWAPRLVQRLSRREDAAAPAPGREEARTLRQLARKTWYYYQDLVGPQSSHLPPDNYQVDPPNGIDTRTSPTNIGFYLLAVLAARDFGFISTLELVRRLDATLDSVEKMRRWKGHLFNWYDTRDLELLRPWFVSTVDSGNFVTMLVVLARGLREYLDRPVIDAGAFQGLMDTLEAEVPVPKELDIVQWSALIADLEKEGRGGRAGQLLSWLREEVDALFPRQDLMASPPRFLGKEAYRPLARVVEEVQKIPSLGNLVRCYDRGLAAVESCLPAARKEEQGYLLALRDEMQRCRAAAGLLADALENLAQRAEKIVAETDFSALYNRERDLFSIGYSVDEEKLLDSYYDLLASEARIASFLAVVCRWVPVRHWLKPGRAATRIGGKRALVSWAGTMFEYLMPALFHRTYPNTLLAETVETVIDAQQRYARKRNRPWGVSESGYYAFDYRLNYQYKAFGIPDLGLKRGLAEDMVVSSYSTFLALPFAPRAAADNLAALREQGLEGEYGLYEAVDYTPARTGGHDRRIVKSYMAHHQGMSLVALANYLLDFAMVRRFHADPRVEAGKLLLQERIPLQPVLTKKIREPVLPLKHNFDKDPEVVRSFGVPRSPLPNCHLLSNGSYTVLLTDSGSGFSKREHIQVSRWRAERHFRHGTFIFIKSLNNDRVWSATYAPLGQEPDFYRVRFKQDRASYFREDRYIDTRTDVIVSGEDNAEIRQVVLTNHSNRTVELEVTSYLEVALSHQAADVAHPAFNKLFVQTELLAEHNCLIASRRPRAHGEEWLYAMHQAVVEGESIGTLQYETDRARFLGRGRDITRPVALHQPLSNSAGAVLDPIFSLRRQIRLGPGQTGVVTFITAQGTRTEILKLAEKYRDAGAVKRAFDLAYTRSLVETRFLNIGSELLRASLQALGHLLFPSPLRRRYASAIAHNTLSQRALWAQGISGDNPIVLVEAAGTQDLDMVEEALRAHEYWRFKGLMVDLVILTSGGGYFEPVRDAVRQMAELSQIAELDRPGGVYIRNVHQLTEAERLLFRAAARLVLKGGRSLARQLEGELPQWPGDKVFSGTGEYTGPSLQPPEDLLFFNGIGGFSRDGSEYVIWLRQRPTPAPWINILANPRFGCTVSEQGGGYTFAENSRENKLTPWSNDPVSDPPGEVLYLRDEETGAVWTVTPAPLGEKEGTLVVHGKGYTRFCSSSHGLSHEKTVFVARDDPVKLTLLRLKNHSAQKRTLSLTYYVRPVLGVSEQAGCAHIVSAMEGDIFTLRNPYNGDFPGRIAWLKMSLPVSGYTGDDAEFLGVPGDLSRPAAMRREGLSNTAGAGLDPCAALQGHVTLAPGEEREILLQLGQGTDMDAVREISGRYTLSAARAELEAVQDFWRSLTEKVSARTPDPALDVLLGWLVYQTVACRLWARTGFYQCGGAYGFRDQLQDAVNMALLAPRLTRRQILLHAAHQFKEGDVQHWWHPGTNNRGVRTRFSDDLLWLPYAVAEYIELTGDAAILDEEIPFLEAAPLAEGEDERYGEAEAGGETASLYEHCRRAIQRALRFGRHGIPLMGSGDWNDGMSTVGNRGQGESVWLGWFLIYILRRFAPLCRARGDAALAEHWLAQAQNIARALEEKGWDGRWYRRAYFDDGTPLGSAENPECSIDSIAQSWAVIAGGDRRDRQEEAMAEVLARLVNEEQGLIMLLAPPFDKSDLNPGYIKGYPPGVRENGGQYTHAACWVIQAMALLGRGDAAGNLLQLINPVNHSRTHKECFTYKTEPYVLAADVYTVAPHTGRGGWTWYTGAAGWLFRVCVQNILGLRRRGEMLVIEPCIPREWREYTLQYRWGTALYLIHVRNPHGVCTGVRELRLDGRSVECVPLQDDGKEHRVEVILGR